MSNILEKNIDFYNYLKQKGLSAEGYFDQIELEDFTEFSKNENLYRLLNECGSVVLKLNTCNGLSEEVLARLAINQKVKYQFVEDLNNNGYSLEELVNIYNTLQTIKDITDNSETTIAKIVTVCVIVTYLVWPDENANKSLTRSLNGSFFSGLAVCQGYALTLKIILNYLGIETFLVAGYGDSTLHAWNQVKDGIFYNLDLTFDWQAFLMDLPLNNTLKNDEQFYETHKKTTFDDYTNLKECPQSISNQDLRYYTMIIPEDLRRFLVDNQMKGLSTIINYKSLSKIDSRSSKL